MIGMEDGGIVKVSRDAYLTPNKKLLVVFNFTLQNCIFRLSTTLSIPKYFNNPYRAGELFLNSESMAGLLLENTLKIRDMTEEEFCNWLVKKLKKPMARIQYLS